MAYTALKPCKFAGQKFRIGETIPEELVQPGAAKNLIKAAIIAIQESHNDPLDDYVKSLISITIEVEEGKLNLELTLAGLQNVFDVMCANVTNAVTIIKQMTDLDALILIDVCDKRKSVQDATKARGKELAGNG